MENEFINLSVSEFLDVISGKAEVEEYTVTLSRGHNMVGTLKSLTEDAIYYKNCDIGDELAAAVFEISKRPIHKYQITSQTDIVCYVENKTDNYDTDKVIALFADAANYYYSIPDIDKKTTRVMEQVRFMKDYLKSKLPKTTEASTTESPNCTDVQCKQSDTNDNKCAFDIKIITKIYDYCVATSVLGKDAISNVDFINAVSEANFKAIYDHAKIKKSKTKVKYTIYALSNFIGRKWYQVAANSIGEEPTSCSRANVPKDWKKKLQEIR